MKSIFNLDDKNDIVNRLDQLHPDSKPMWGKMSVSQMLGALYCTYKNFNRRYTRQAKYIWNIIR